LIRSPTLWSLTNACHLGVELCGYLGGFGGTEPLEDLQRLPQLICCLSGAAAARAHRLRPASACASWEPVRQPVRGVHGKRRLTDPGHPADRVNSDHAAGPSRGLRQLLKFPLPPGERGHIAGQ
jgi:hypothetical protein